MVIVTIFTVFIVTFTFPLSGMLREINEVDKLNSRLKQDNILRQLLLGHIHEHALKSSFDLIDSDNIKEFFGRDLGIPVVYICFGPVPLYLKINAELASRRNHVIVISNSYLNHSHVMHQNRRIDFIPLQYYQTSSIKFAGIYKHLCKDVSSVRQRHELQCLQRWFVLRDFMKQAKINNAFFADGDVGVFTNVTYAWAVRSNCSAVLNVESQGQVDKWTAAGESSLWTLSSIHEFCDFTFSIYKNYVNTLMAKWRFRSCVVDMSLLWLWWVAHKSGSEDIQPYLHWDPSASQETTRLHRVNIVIVISLVVTINYFFIGFSGKDRS